MVSVAKIANAIAISKCLCGVEIPHFLFGGLIAPARNLVLKTSGTSTPLFIWKHILMAKELVLKTSDVRESTGGSSPSASAINRSDGHESYMTM